ncbi:MAG: N-methyl-L-tryptophan oxidase [Acidobacteriaceae bacterium]
MTTPAYDVIVVGLGAVGSAVLCQAKQSGASVLGIDRFHPPHEFGSSHGETRITRQAIGEGLQFVPLVLRANVLWRDLEAATGKQLLVQDGGLILTDHPTHGPGAAFFQQTVEAARQFTIPHQILSSAEMRDRFPQFAFPDEGAAYFEPGAGYLYVEKCIEAHLELALQKGAAIHGGEIVNSIVPSSRHVVVQTDKNSYVASSVVLTPGPWMPDWAARISGLPASTFQIYRQILYWLSIGQRRHLFSPERMPVFIWSSAAQEKNIYGFPSLDGESLKIATEQFDSTTDPDAPPIDIGEDQVRSFHQEFVQKRFPDVTARDVRTASCFYTQTANHSFVIDQATDSDRIWFASACSGHGFKHSPAVGEALAQKALGQQTVLDLSPFARSRLVAS